MDRGLWLLIALRVRGWARRVARGVGTVRGALLMVVGALVFLPLVLTWFSGPREVTPGTHEDFRRYGPPLLALYCIINVLFTSEGALTFSAAEVSFLFPAPLTRRQLLRYKLIVTAASSLLTGTFMALAFRIQPGGPLAAIVALSLVVFFMQLVPMVLTLVASTVGTHVYNRRRKVALALIAFAAVVALTQAVEALATGPQGVAAALQGSPVGQVLLAPFAWFVNALLSVEVWPELARWAGLSCLTVAALVALVFALDAHYLEASAAASERAYERLESARRGGPAAAPTGRVRLALPGLPHWGGVGTLAWRQLTAALRSPWPPLALLALYVGSAVAFAAADATPARRVENLQYVSVALIFGLTLFVSVLLPFDFRGDVDRIEALKTLPLPAWRVALGQLAAPALLLTLIQWLALCAGQLTLGRIEPVYALAALFAPPFTFIVLAIDNMIFLWFPARMATATPGDLQALGRQVLLWMVKLVVLNVVLLFAALSGVAAYFLAGRSTAAAGAAAFVVLLGACAALVPLVALAFKQFDVARDTPP